MAYVSYRTVAQPQQVGPALAVLLRIHGVWPLVSVTSTSTHNTSHTGTRQSRHCSRKSLPACCLLLVPGRDTSVRLVTVYRDETKSCRISGEGIVQKRSSFGKILCHAEVGRCGGRNRQLDHEENEKRSSHLQMGIRSVIWFRL